MAGEAGTVTGKNGRRGRLWTEKKKGRGRPFDAKNRSDGNATSACGTESQVWKRPRLWEGSLAVLRNVFLGHTFSGKRKGVGRTWGVVASSQRALVMRRVCVSEGGKHSGAGGTGAPRLCQCTSRDPNFAALGAMGGSIGQEKAGSWSGRGWEGAARRRRESTGRQWQRSRRDTRPSQLGSNSAIVDRGHRIGCGDHQTG